MILPHVGGEVTAVDGSTITVEQPRRQSATITVNGDTEYQVNGDAATLADVEVGMFLVAEGTENGDGSLTATKVKAGDRGRFFGGRGFGLPAGPGLRPRLRLERQDPDATAAPQRDGSAS